MRRSRPHFLTMIILPLLALGTSVQLPADEMDDRIDRLNELVKDIPTVVAERRADTAVVTGWTRNKEEKKLLDKAIDLVGDVEDFTVDDVDDPNRMVEIDVAIVVVRNIEKSSVGFNFLQLINLQFEFERERSARGGIGGVTDVTHNLNASVDYLVNIANAEDDRVSIVARPHLATLNGEKAEFQAGGEIVFKVSGLNSGRIQPYPYGINLTVTPTVLRTTTEDGRTQVLLDVDASRLTVLGFETLASTSDSTADEDVSFEKVQVKSKALLPMEETLILSGLYQRENREVYDGVPFLRKIPIIKYFFSNRSEVDEVLSTVIFITPRNPEVLNESSQKKLDAFIQRRLEYIEARESGDAAIQEFKATYHDWYKPQPNRYASFFFLRTASRIFRELRGEDLRTESIRRDIVSVQSVN